jgi:acetyl-CoA C-acetyltransferase
MGDTKMVDMMVGALHDPFHTIHMGVTAENIAAKWGITREDQDAARAREPQPCRARHPAGLLQEPDHAGDAEDPQGRCGVRHRRALPPNCSMEDMAKLKPAFLKENGTVTAGNASGINDAAAAVVLMEAATAKARGLKPLARLVGYAHAGVDPKYMGIGPVPASQKALKKAGLTVQDLDVIEANEAFAAQACAVTRDLGLDPAKVNPNGSGISLGHPIGATGALITVKALYELQRIGGPLRAGHDVHRRRPGHRGDLRTHRLRRARSIMGR